MIALVDSSIALANGMTRSKKTQVVKHRCQVSVTIESKGQIVSKSLRTETLSCRDPPESVGLTFSDSGPTSNFGLAIYY